jgi:hypothetical protein
LTVRDSRGFLVLLLALATGAGCGRSVSTRVESLVPEPIAPRAPSTLDEAQVLEIARQAVAANDTWIDRAEFETPRRTDSGWTVLVWRLPKMPGGHRLVLIDATGQVTGYLRGS